MTPMFDGREMVLLHDVFRRELGLAPAAIERVGAGDRERAAAVGGHIAAVSTLLHHHHASEDEYIWPLLRQRSLADATALVGLMEGQHATVADLGDRVQRALRTWIDDPAPDHREAVVGWLHRLLPALRTHLSIEEKHVVPLMERVITAAEHAEIVREGAGAADPAAMPLWFGMLMYEGDPEVVETALSSMPPSVGAVVRVTAPGAYADHALAVHGTATPPRSAELH